MSIVIHLKTRKIYILKALFAKNATNGKEHMRFAVYKRPFRKQLYVRECAEFCMKFDTLKMWLFPKKEFDNREEKS